MTTPAVRPERCEVAIVGSGFAGSLLARILAKRGYHVVLLERGTHPRFAIGESTTPLANLSLERLARRYGMQDCYELAAHGRWLETHAHVRRGLKRGFTFYRHHPGDTGESLASERLLVAASPDEYVSDTHWLREDVDHHFLKRAVDDHVEYRDRVDVTSAAMLPDGVHVRLDGQRDGEPFRLETGFVVDGSGGKIATLLTRTRAISGVEHTHTRSGILFSHFTHVGLARDAFPEFPSGPYPDDWAAVHHLIDEGWMYSLRFDHGVTSAGFALRPNIEGLTGAGGLVHEPDAMWARLMERYPTIATLFAKAKPTFPLKYEATIQRRLAQATGTRWACLPHSYAFVDPLFSTGIAWSLRGVERLAASFTEDGKGRHVPTATSLGTYEQLLAREADQIDRMVAAAYEAMAHFDLFAAHAMIYFATVSYAETSQRLAGDERAAPWSGFLGVGDPVLEPLPWESLSKLRRLKTDAFPQGTPERRTSYGEWVREAIAARNVAGLADPARRNLYPVDLNVLIDGHHLLGRTRDEVVAALPRLRGTRYA